MSVRMGFTISSICLCMAACAADLPAALEQTYVPDGGAAPAARPVTPVAPANPNSVSGVAPSNPNAATPPAVAANPNAANPNTAVNPNAMNPNTTANPNTTPPAPPAPPAYSVADLTTDMTTVLQPHTPVYSTENLGNKANVAKWDANSLQSLYDGIVAAHAFYPRLALKDLAHLVLALGATDSTGNLPNKRRGPRRLPAGGLGQLRGRLYQPRRPHQRAAWGSAQPNKHRFE